VNGKCTEQTERTQLTDDVYSVSASQASVSSSQVSRKRVFGIES